MYKQLYIDTYSKILPSVEMEESIYNKTINKSSKNHFFSTKAIVTVSVIIIAMLGGILSVRAASRAGMYKGVLSLSETEKNIITETVAKDDENSEITSKDNIVASTDLTDKAIDETVSTTTEIKNKQEKYGWQYLNGYWYYYKNDGTVCVDGWHEIDGEWYFFASPSGELLTNTWIGNCYVDNGGRWIKDAKPPISIDSNNNFPNNAPSKTILYDTFYKENLSELELYENNNVILSLNDKDDIYDFVLICFANSEDSNFQAEPSTPRIYRIKIVLKNKDTEWISIYYSSRNDTYYCGYGGSFFQIDINQIRNYL